MQPNTIETIIARGVRNENGCLIWPFGKTDKGYGIVSYQGKTWRLHRLIWTEANGPIPDGLVVAHSCDTPACYELSCLRACTQTDNLRDMYERGRNSTRLGAKWSAESRQRGSDARTAVWASYSEEERRALGAASGASRQGKRRGPYKGRTGYAKGYKPV